MTTTPVLLREAVERAIMTYDPIRTGETVIDVDVQDGNVVLNGYVRSDTMRNVATQLAQGVRGVRAVRNNLFSDTDLEIMAAQAVEVRLGSYVVPMMPMVRALRGHLFLRGPVPAESARELITETASAVPGVVQVHSLLEVDPAAIERLVAPKKAARAAARGGAASGQALVGGKPVTAADLPDWAMKPKTAWGMADFKARARAKMAFKRGDGADPNEMETAGTILRGGEAGEATDDTVEEPTPVAAEPVATLDDAPAEEANEADDVAPAAVDMAALQAQFPAWALKPKEEWDKDDFKAQMSAKRAAKAGEGESPETIIEKAQAALAAARSGGRKKQSGGAKNAQEAAITRVREQFPGWALAPRKDWRAADFQEAADARVAELRGKDRSVKERRAEAQAALEAAMRGEAVEGGGVAKRRDLTPEEVEAVRQGLVGQFPAWALKPKEAWDQDDFKGQMAAKRAAKSGASDPPETVIEQAQAALAAALKDAHAALPLEGGDGGAIGGAVAVSAPVAAGPKAITPDLLAKYPGWALKPKEEWTPEEFKAHAKAKSAAKKGEGPDPDAITAEAQAALG